MTTDGENPGVLILHAPEGTILTTHELDCTLKVLGPIPHLAGLKVELDFLSNSAQSASSHIFHYTAVKVHSHWYCHFYFENVFRLQEAAMERNTDTNLACFSVSSRRKLPASQAWQSAYPTGKTICFHHLKAAQNVAAPTVIIYFCICTLVVSNRGNEHLSKSIMFCLNMQCLECFCSKILTWKSRWFVNSALTSDFHSDQANLKSVMFVPTENSFWHISNTL